MQLRPLIAGTVLAGCLITGAQAQQPARTGPPREAAEEAVRVWNATGTLRVSGDYLVEAAREVTGDIAMLDGELTIAGHVTGRVVAINAAVRLLATARVDGGILVVGGDVSGRELGTVAGTIRAFPAPLDYTREGDQLATIREGESDDSQRWWRRRERWRSGGWTDLRLVSARTYNRIEGLPVFIGPRLGRATRAGRLSVDAFGVVRSADGFEWKPENVGHSLKVELEVGPRGKVRLGGRLFDLVDAVESWQLSDPEVGLSSFVLHRDFRDYYNKHGGALQAHVITGRHSSVGLSYSDQRWAARSTRDPWTLIRNDQRWRDNPVMDEGTMHLLNASLRYDSRNDSENPWTGWFLVADYEFGTGTIHRYGATSPGVRDRSPTGETTYDRLLVDIRRYNRISPDGQLNFRLVAGGWLSGDDLPLQRRFSLGGPGSLAGYDFRRSNDERNVLQCSTPSAAGSTSGPRGRPAQCERFAMAQVEFRGDVHVDPFGVLDGERDSRRAGWGRGTQWVLFADAGRGWLVGPSDGELVYGKGAIPSLSTFRLDVGLGLVLDNIGIYAAKGVNGRSTPINVFVRLQPRF